MNLPPFAVQALLLFCNRVMQTPPSQILGYEGDTYLHRWFLEKDKELGSVYVHEMIRSDVDQEFHDHPGDNLSIILSGTMIEHTPNGIFEWHPGSVIARKATDKHRVEIHDKLITMWIMGPRVREWGFWEQTPEGDKFIPSQDFFKMRGYF